MSQEKVYNYLKKHRGNKYGCRELAEKLHLNMSTVTNNCKRLRKTRIVKFEIFEGIDYKEWRYWI